MAMMRNPDHMSVDDVIQELNSLQEEIKLRGQRVHGLAQSLYHRTRRATATESTPIYLTYANLMLRFGGAVGQISVRTGRSSRILGQLPEDVSVSSPGPEVKPVAESAVKPVPLSPVESLLNLYSGEGG